MAKELILIVEDNDRNLKLLRDVLGAKGYITIESITAEEGIELARQQHPDLILMDIELPGIDGITAFKQLRADPATQSIPIIAVTASVMPTDRRRILGAGFDGYITKPISVKEFLVEVRSLLDRISSSEGG